MSQDHWAAWSIVIPEGATGEVDTLCPKCSGNRRKSDEPCLSVNVEKGAWFCWHCEWSGGLGSGEKTPSRPPKAHIPIVLPAPESVSKVKAWFARRGITEDVLVRNGICASERHFKQVDKRLPCAWFPYRRDGEVVNVKYRGDGKVFQMHPGADMLLYKLDDIDPEQVIVVEGEIDALSFEMAGYRSCVSVPGGAPPEKKGEGTLRMAFLEADEVRLSGVRKWIVAVDADGPGRRLESELCRRLGPEKCWVVSWPDGCKDANDVLVQFGPGGLVEAVRKARPCPVDGIFSGADLREAALSYLDRGRDPGEAPGWDSLAQLFTVRPGEMTIVTGMPGSGKSQFVENIMVNLANSLGWASAIYSPENQPVEAHAVIFTERFAKAPADDSMPRDIFLQHYRNVEDYLNWINPEDDWKVETLLDRAKVFVYRKGIKILLVDPWNELIHQRPANLREDEYISWALGRFRRFGRTYGVHVFIVAHPKNMERVKVEAPDKTGGMETRNTYPVPTLSDISGGATWRAKADNGLVVWRDPADLSRRTLISVQKIRNRDIGKLGVCWLQYDLLSGTFSDTGDVRLLSGESFSVLRDTSPPAERPRYADPPLSEESGESAGPFSDRRNAEATTDSAESQQGEIFDPKAHQAWAAEQNDWIVR